MNSRLQKIFNLYNNKSLEEARENIVHLLTESPDSGAACCLAGLVFHGLGRIELATQWINRSIMLEPNNYSYYYYRSHINIARGNSRGAVDDMTSAFSLRKDKDMFISLIHLLQKTGDIDDAKKLYDAHKETSYNNFVIIAKPPVQHKIAVFISGPVRYVDLVIENVNKIMKGIDHDFMIHIWKFDASPFCSLKHRPEREVDIIGIASRKDVKTFVYNAPYSNDDLKIFGELTIDGHSGPAAVLGMHIAVNQLCNNFESLPDRGHYTHIMRVRTDCAFISENFMDNIDLNANAIYLGDNPFDHLGSFSDSFFLAPAEVFLKIWKFSRVEDIFYHIDIGCRNPERALTFRKHIVANDVPVFEKIYRFVDYHTLYAKETDDQPEWINKTIKEGRIHDIFSFNNIPTRQQRIMEADAVINSIRTKLSSSIYPSWTSHPDEV